MPAALKAFAEQAHMQVLYDYDAVASVRCNPVEGEFEKQEALTRLLLNTGLEARYASEQAYVDRLLGEPVYGVADVHVHPLEPIGFRLTISKGFLSDLGLSSCDHHQNTLGQGGYRAASAQFRIYRSQGGEVPRLCGFAA
jgi:hypothetical protein